jgi:hypothetical protein
MPHICLVCGVQFTRKTTMVTHKLYYCLGRPYNPPEIPTDISKNPTDIKVIDPTTFQKKKIQLKSNINANKDIKSISEKIQLKQDINVNTDKVNQNSEKNNVNMDMWKKINEKKRLDEEKKLKIVTTLNKSIIQKSNQNSHFEIDRLSNSQELDNSYENSHSDEIIECDNKLEKKTLHSLPDNSTSLNQSALSDNSILNQSESQLIQLMKQMHQENQQKLLAMQEKIDKLENKSNVIIKNNTQNNTLNNTQN